MSSEIQEMFDVLQADDTATFISEGYHVDQELSFAAEEKHVFFDSSLSLEDNALLNMEVDDRIETLIIELAKAKGKLPQPLVEDELDDVYVITMPLIDHEKCLEKAIPILDEYFDLGEKLQEAMDQSGWLELRHKKAAWWSLFNEEINFNWLRLDKYDDQADRRLHQLASNGQEPTEDKWQLFFEKRSLICKECDKLKDKRISTTYSLYQKALKATSACKLFWESGKGNEINGIRQRRKELYELLQEPQTEYFDVGLDNKEDIYRLWDYIPQYFQLRAEEINLYMTSGDTEEVDNPDYSFNKFDSMVVYAETHLQEQRLLNEANIRWEKWYSNWMDWRENQARDRQSQVDMINDELEMVGGW